MIQHSFGELTSKPYLDIFPGDVIEGRPSAYEYLDEPCLTRSFGDSNESKTNVNP